MASRTQPPKVSLDSPSDAETTSPGRQRRRGSSVWAVLGASLLLVGVGAVLLSGGFDREPKLEVVGQERPVNISARSTTDISAHNSPTLARNPTRPANLAVSSRIDTPVFDCALHISLDGGGTWRQTSIPAPKGGGKCYNPDVAFSADGTLYLSFVMLKGRGNVPDSLWMSTSEDGGRTLSEPVRVRGPLTFQVRVAADPVNPERVYLTFLQASEVGTLKFTQTGNPIQIMRSDDGGATWDAPVRVSSAARERVIAPAPVVGRDGILYVLYTDLGDDRLNYEGGHQGTGGEPYPGPTSLVLSRSSDGGESWVESVAADDLVPIQRFVVFLAQFPSVAVDSDGRVFAAFHSATLGDPDVWLWSLERGASSWSEAVRVNDTRRRDGTAQYLPKLSVAPDGRLDVLYYDRRADPENLRNHVSLQSSFDHGETFTESVRLTSRPSDSRIGFGAKEGLPDLGSRLGLLSTDRAALGLWTDTRAGVPETQKQDLAEGAVAVTPPEELSAGVEAALRFGGIALCVAGLALLAVGFRRRGTAAPV